MENKNLTIVAGIVCLAVGLVLGFVIQGALGKKSGPVQVTLDDGKTLKARLDEIESNLQKSMDGVTDKTNTMAKQVNDSQAQIINTIVRSTSERDIFDTGNAPVLGKPDAAITVVEFSDFQCPYCGKMAAMLKDLMAKNQDAFKVIFIDFPLNSQYKDGFPFHPYAFLASEVAQEALAQGKFEPMYDYIFQNQQTIFPGRPTDKNDYAKLLGEVRDKLVAQAQAIGMDTKKLNEALDKHTHQKALENKIALGKKVNVQGTPTTFVSSYIKMADPQNQIPQFIEEAKGNK